MRFNTLKNWIMDQIDIKKRLKNICVWYLLFLMVSTRKHSLEEAARFSRINKSQFSRFLRKHSDLPVYTLDSLSKKRAKQFSGILKALDKNTLPWSIGILRLFRTLSG